MADNYSINLKQAASELLKTAEAWSQAASAYWNSENRLIELLQFNDESGHNQCVVDTDRGCVLLTSTPNLYRRIKYEFLGDMVSAKSFAACLGNAKADTLEPCPQRMSCLRFTCRGSSGEQPVDTFSDDYAIPCDFYIKDVTVPPAAS